MTISMKLFNIVLVTLFFSSLLASHAAFSNITLFTFGDSFVDPGNNNFIKTKAQANFAPYGRDFKGGATGRFSNGKIFPDFLAKHIGLKGYKAYLSFDGVADPFRTAVSFCSATSGYVVATSRELDAIPLSGQADLFKNYANKLEKKLGLEESKRLIARSMFYINVGSEDFAFSFVGVDGKPKGVDVEVPPVRSKVSLDLGLDEIIISRVYERITKREQENDPTIFAPTDEAFKAKRLLRFHADPNQTDLSLWELGLDTIYTLATNNQGEYKLFSQRNPGGVNILTGRSDPKVSKSNIVIEDSSLYLYKIDQVLLPIGFPAGSTSEANITGILSLAGCNKFANLIATTRSVLEAYQMASKKGLQIFAPTDEAFESEDLPDLSKLTTDQLVSLLLYHAVGSFYPLSTLVQITKPISTLASNSREKYQIGIKRYGFQVFITTAKDKGAKLTDIEFEISPIMIYSIDNVLIPKELSSSLM